MTLDHAVNANGADHDAPPTTGATSQRSARGGWTDVEEARLLKIVLAAGLRSGRTTNEQWQSVADVLARDGQTLGFPRRTGSSCRQRASKLGVYQHTHGKIEPEVATVQPVQRSFGEIEVKHLLADILDRIAAELRA